MIMKEPGDHGRRMRDDESTNERNNHGGAVATNDRPAQDTLILDSRTDAR